MYVITVVLIDLEVIRNYFIPKVSTNWKNNNCIKMSYFPLMSKTRSFSVEWPVEEQGNYIYEYNGNPFYIGSKNYR